EEVQETVNLKYEYSVYR
uniref:Unknown protein 2 (Fragments) n=1 Tax=Lonomia obliqua TaxID=304329 RepID=UP02_LONON|nr:RecName: Full=Unknown protein 2 [Lonomia obliqua]